MLRWLQIIGLGAALAAMVWKKQPRPRVVLWLWERPEAISNVSGAAFAVLCGSFEIGPDSMRYRPRLQPVRLPEGAETTAVFRIDVAEGIAVPADALAHRIVSAVPPDAHAVQIDFDARVSERAAYRELLRLLRRDLPQDVKLSMTALASWCMDDPWIRDLPVDEAVPMLFQMGLDGPAVRRYVERGGSFHVPLCRGSAGLSLSEPVLRFPHGLHRIYVFSPERWNAQSVARAMNAGALL